MLVVVGMLSYVSFQRDVPMGKKCARMPLGESVHASPFLAMLLLILLMLTTTLSERTMDFEPAGELLGHGGRVERGGREEEGACDAAVSLALTSSLIRLLSS